MVLRVTLRAAPERDIPFVTIHKDFTTAEEACEWVGSKMSPPLPYLPPVVASVEHVSTLSTSSVAHVLFAANRVRQNVLRESGLEEKDLREVFLLWEFRNALEVLREDKDDYKPEAYARRRTAISQKYKLEETGFSEENT